MTRILPYIFALLLPLSVSAEVPQDSSPEVRRTVRAYASDMVKCFGKTHKRYPDARGYVTVRMDVSDQHATQTQTIADTVGVRSLSRCVERRTSRWFYEGVVDGSYTWRFDFRVGTDARE